MKVETLVVGYLKTNCYIVSKDRDVLVIDPGDEVDKIIHAIGDRNVREILITHNHFDHIGALEELKSYYGLIENQRSGYFEYEVINVPGHTMDSKCYYFKDIKALFVGDFIFNNGIGRCDLGGDINTMISSLKMFFERFNDEVIYPGHGFKTSVVDERKNLKNYLNVSE